MISVTFGSDIMRLNYTVSKLGVVFLGHPVILNVKVVPNDIFFNLAAKGLNKAVARGDVALERLVKNVTCS